MQVCIDVGVTCESQVLAFLFALGVFLPKMLNAHTETCRTAPVGKFRGRDYRRETAASTRHGSHEKRSPIRV